jgi:glycosyltransferase involved in cell wall biosynthesis
VAGFRPDVVIVCPLGKWGVAVGAAAARFAHAPLITYFMDDWPGTIAPYPEVARLLQVADAWLVISDRLREVFVTRYRSIAPPTLVVHNPARPSRGRSAVGDAIRSTAAPTNSAGPFTVVYAGSIQPMHFDALVATARAIADLRGRGVRSKLVVHTHPSFWTAHESVWRDLGVENGGLISHALLEARLRDADLLLVVASFLPTHAPMSQSSVQTKLTDYMAAGRPIFGVGPAGAASLEFIERWQLGVTCTAPEPQSIAAALEKWMATGVARESFERTAHEALKMHFDPDVVRPKLWQFVANVALRSPNLASAPSNDRA